MVSDEISASPPLSSSRTIADTIFSTRSGSTWRLRKEICSERTSLSRSNGTRRPLRLMTVSSRSCTRSNVVKRKLQAIQTRRLRITAESSVGRESFTWVSRLLQLGQRIDHPASSFRDAPSWAQTRNPALCTVLDSGFAPSGASRNDGGCSLAACSISLLQHHAVVGREPRCYALARTVGVHVESRGIG